MTVDFSVVPRRWDGEPRLLEPDKAAALRWFRFGALPDPVVPYELFVLERLHASRVEPVVAYGF